ncbi:DUF4153 domain-containing protein [Mycobacterium talmoniae]|uniref:DUF4153 domain-containing protein n=1 Tax=Mycobacterium talmoniae TaxID=1858794 RepID=UPI0009F5C6A3|nr:DUF4173 domain-containing protein [Mycobacterium talmoniae]
MTLITPGPPAPGGQYGPQLGGPVLGPRRPEPGEPGWTIWPHRIWPIDVGAAAPRRVVALALLAALLGTLVWRVTVFSVGYLLVGALVFGVVYGTARRSPTRQEWAGMAMTLALLAVPAVLAAEWVDALCVAAAWIVGWCTFVGGRSWTAVFAGPLLAWAVPARVVGWTQRTLRRIELPGGSGDLRRLAIVLATTVVLVAAFGGLFAGADVAFAHVLSGLLPALDVGEFMARSVVFTVVLAFVLFGAYLIRFPPRLDAAAPRIGWTVARWEWAVPVAALDTLFVAFVAVQATVLFGGHRHVLETAGLTYAEYARQGFWQLLVVSALTVLVIAVTLQLAARDTAADRRLIRSLVGLLCAMSVVVVASAVHRMWLYQQAYGFTELRLLVITVELWLGAVFVLIAGCGIRMAAEWLPRAVLAAGVAALLGLAAVNPDRLIAQRNIERYAQTGHLDASYLTGLSADALPALDGLPESMRGCVGSWVTEDEREPWYQFNWSRWRASRAGVSTQDRAAWTRGCEPRR